MKHVLLSVAIAATPAMIAIAAAAGPNDFLDTAIKGDNSEIKLGQLAEKQGGTAQVRNFGKRLVTDHTKAKAEVAKTAKAMGVNVTEDVMPEAQQEYDKLAGLNGSAFDTEFTRYMKEDHQKDIKEFEEQAKAGDTKVGPLAKQQLPTLREHLKMAEKLEGEAAK
jgi:putative membrane protein